MNREKKKKGGGLALIGVAFAIVFNIMARLDAENIALGVFVMILLVAVLVLISVFGAIIKAVKNRGGTPEEDSPARREPAEDRPRSFRRESEEDRPSVFRREPLEDKPISRSQRELLPMDEYERRKRIEQLDGFLKNGIIDKAEYRKLRARYEK